MNYSFPQNPPNMFPQYNAQIQPGGQTQNPEGHQVTGNQSEENKGFSAEVRLPAHVKKLHVRSNSVTPVDSGTDKYMKSSFLFDKVNNELPSPLPFVKTGSENVNSGMKLTGPESSQSLPAIKNLSDFYDSAVSDSSCFDGKDSELASSVDIELDANGQPYFDNMSVGGGSNKDGVEGEDGSEEIPVRITVKGRMAKGGVKKKSGF